MSTQLILTPVKAYQIIASIEERKSECIGIYRSKEIAHAKSQKAGWYGSNGTVSEIDVYVDNDDNIYTINKIQVKFTEDITHFENVIANKLNNNFTQQEIDYIKSKPNLLNSSPVKICGTVSNYSELSSLNTDILNNGDTYINKDDGLLYIYNGSSFPLEGNGFLSKNK